MRVGFLFLVLSLVGEQTHARGGGRVVSPEPVEVPVVCVDSEGPKLVTLGDESDAQFKVGGVKHELASQALCWLNAVYANGCLKEKILARSFSTLERDALPAFKRTENAKAWELSVKGAPYPMGLRRYYTRTSVLGYTFFDRDSVSTWGSETRMWSNFNRYWTPEIYGAHIAHELTHQRRSGAFGHWSRHSGSYPYEFGDAASECIAKLKGERVQKLNVAH